MAWPAPVLVGCLVVDTRFSPSPFIRSRDNASTNQQNETRFLLELVSWMQALQGLFKDTNCIFPLNCSEARLQREARYAKPPYPYLPRPPGASDNVDGNRNKREKRISLPTRTSSFPTTSPPPSGGLENVTPPTLLSRNHAWTFPVSPLPCLDAPCALRHI